MVLIPQELDGFDIPAAVARMLDRPELWWQAVGFFVCHFADWKTSWLAAVGEDQAERRQVHAIRSAAANVGAAVLADRAEKLERTLLRRIAGEQIEVPAADREALASAFDLSWGNASAAWQQAGCDLPGQA